MLWKKDPSMKYTDMCIWIDGNVSKLANPGEFPEVEDLIYNYLWLLVKALAIKKRLFEHFEDYDPYAFYAAQRLFFALQKNLKNQGKTIKGKQIKPIKSCLNYTKTLLYPMKVDYQKEAYREIINDEFTSKKFDSFSYQEQMRSEARESQGVSRQFWEYAQSSLLSSGALIDKVLARSPFQKGTPDYKHLRISIMINALNSMKLKKKLDAEVPTIVLWKLPKSMASYTRILLREFCTEIKKEIMDCHAMAYSGYDDNMMDKIISCSTLDEDAKNEEQY